MSGAIQFTPYEVSAYYAARTPNLKQARGGKRRGPCPVHRGKDENFAVNPETGLCFCYSQCQRGWDIVGLEMALAGVDFQTAKTEVFRLVGRSEQPTSKWRETARFPYVDCNGSLLSEVVRYLKPDGSKTFVQVRPSGVEAAGTTDPERVGGVEAGGIVVGLEAGEYIIDPKATRATGKPTWKRPKGDIKHDGAVYHFRVCPRVPYRLPKLLNAETVYLPEGEKDVHTLEDWGLVASCNPGGCGGTGLYADWLKFFSGKHLVIPFDNDAPGRKHAVEKATILLPVGRSVRIVELPGLQEGGDVTDWRNAGGTVEEFHGLVAAAPMIDQAALVELRARWGLVDDEPRHQAQVQERGGDRLFSPTRSEIRAGGSSVNTATEIISHIRISEVWVALGGGPLRHRRGRAFWRNGDGYNVSLSDEKGVWYDFVAGAGGGVLDLVQHVRGGGRADALKFVAELAGLTLDSRPLSRQEKRAHAEHVRQAKNLAQQCAWWVRAYAQALEHTKASAYEHGDWDTLAWSARELYRVQTAVAAALLGRFLNAMKSDPEATAGFVEAGRDDEWHAYAITVAITIMGAQAAEDQKRAEENSCAA